MSNRCSWNRLAPTGWASVVLCLAVSSWGGSASGSPARRPADRKGAPARLSLQIYQELADAYERREPEAVLKHLAPDFRSTVQEVGGQPQLQDRATFERDLRQFLASQPAMPAVAYEFGYAKPAGPKAVTFTLWIYRRTPGDHSGPQSLSPLRRYSVIHRWVWQDGWKLREEVAKAAPSNKPPDPVQLTTGRPIESDPTVGGPKVVIENPLGKQLLPQWPGTSPYEVADAFNCKKFLENPNDPQYGGRLPYYGVASPYEVDEDLKAVWRLLVRPNKNGDDAFPWIRGEHPQATWTRISAPLMAYLETRNNTRRAAKLPLLTEAHQDVLKFAVIAFWTETHMRYPHPNENPNHDPGVLAVIRNAENLAGSQRTGPDVPPTSVLIRGTLNFATALLNQNQLVGTCGHYTAVVMAFSHYAGLRASVLDCSVDNVEHANVTLYVKSVAQQRYGLQTDQSAKGIGPAPILTDATFCSTVGVSRQELAQMPTYPAPESNLVNAKGDGVPHFFKWWTTFRPSAGSAYAATAATFFKYPGKDLDREPRAK